MSSDNETTICCWWPFKPMTPLEMEGLWDDNDNEIIFKNNNPGGEQVIPNEPIDFWSDSNNIGNYFILARKVNYKKKISLILTFKEETDKRVLIDGFLIVDGMKYEVTDFRTHDELKVAGKIYKNIATCNYNG
jgi:hypothetical protein